MTATARRRRAAHESSSADRSRPVPEGVEMFPAELTAPTYVRRAFRVKAAPLIPAMCGGKETLNQCR
jgi:hypothetical protein